MKIEHPRGQIDLLIRQTRVHHMMLSQMADTKANMLLTVAGVIMTLSVQYILEPELRWAVAVLMLTCLITIILAAYAVMPKNLSQKKLSADEAFQSKQSNPLFFGNFFHVKYDEYLDHMEELLNDVDASYEIMLREIYTLGTYLAIHKYRYLRLAYLSFLIGLCASGIILAFSAVKSWGATG